MAVAARLYKWVEYPLLSLFTDNLKCTVHWYAYSLVKLLAIFSVLWRGLYFGRNLLPLQYSLLLLLLLLFSRSVVSNPLATPWTGALQASLGFPRHEYWSRLPFPSSGVLLDLGIEPVFLALAGGFFTTEPPGKFISMYVRAIIGNWKGRKKAKTKAKGDRGETEMECCYSVGMMFQLCKIIKFKRFSV